MIFKFKFMTHLLYDLHRFGKIKLDFGYKSRARKPFEDSFHLIFGGYSQTHQLVRGKIVIIKVKCRNYCFSLQFSWHSWLHIDWMWKMMWARILNLFHICFYLFIFESDKKFEQFLLAATDWYYWKIKNRQVCKI